MTEVVVTEVIAMEEIRMKEVRTEVVNRAKVGCREVLSMRMEYVRPTC